jgi:hypothetical protein
LASLLIDHSNGCSIPFYISSLLGIVCPDGQENECLPSLLLGDDVFEFWVVGFVGFDAVGAECVDGYAFVGVIAIPE